MWREKTKPTPLEPSKTRRIRRSSNDISTAASLAQAAEVSPPPQRAHHKKPRERYDTMPESVSSYFACLTSHHKSVFSPTCSADTVGSQLESSRVPSWPTRTADCDRPAQKASCPPRKPKTPSPGSFSDLLTLISDALHRERYRFQNLLETRHNALLEELKIELLQYDEGAETILESMLQRPRNRALAKASLQTDLEDTALAEAADFEAEFTGENSESDAGKSSTRETPRSLTAAQSSGFHPTLPVASDGTSCSSSSRSASRGGKSSRSSRSFSCAERQQLLERLRPRQPARVHNTGMQQDVDTIEDDVDTIVLLGVFNDSARGRLDINHGVEKASVEEWCSQMPGFVALQSCPAVGGCLVKFQTSYEAKEAIKMLAQSSISAQIAKVSLGFEPRRASIFEKQITTRGSLGSMASQVPWKQRSKSYLL